MEQTSQSRFWKNVNKTNYCWEWIGNKWNTGYGRFSVKRKVISAHRASYLLAYNNIPKGMIICHTCDNRLCVNPEHLYAGTNKDNSDDKINRGRQPDLKGIRNGFAKLTDEQVKLIRIEYKNGGTSYSKLGKKYNTNPTNIASIVRMKTWTHLL